MIMPALNARLSLAASLVSLAACAYAAVTDARIANLTSRSFDLFLRADAPPASATLEVFLDAGGATPASTTVTELQPLFTGATSGDEYARRQANRATRAALTANGNTLFRVTNCETSTTYYVRARLDGTVAWPTNSPLLAVRTLPAAEWNGGARQYLVSLGRDGTGFVGALDAAGSAAPLLSVAGDRATTNSTLFFNLTDCMGPNGLPLGLEADDPLSLTLFGYLGSAATTTTLAGAPPPPENLVASADAFEKNLLRLLVASAAGACSPAPGEHLLFDGSMVTCRLEQTLFTQVSTQYVGIGWTGSGNVPANGRSTAFTFALSGDSSLSWQWRTNFWLEVVSDHGTVDLASGWYRSGTALNASVTPNAEWLFSQWTGLASGSAPAVGLLLNAPGVLRANFDPVLVPGGGGMPEWWLTQAGITGPARDPEADPDGDGMVNRLEWLADTNPTNRTSDLRITALARNGEGMQLTWRGGRESRQIIEVLEGDLKAGNWRPLATNLPPTETVGTCAIQLDGHPTRLFRIKAER